MATLRDIRRRIRSVQSTQKITRAMKLVAAAKLRRAQERILAARPYASKMRELLGNLVSAAGAEGDAAHPLLEQRQGPRRQIVIITADMSAETCDGAAGCASGSQTCTGNSPAFVPNPRSMRTNSTPDEAAPA